MSKKNWIRRFEPLTGERLVEVALESAAWLETYGHIDKDTEYWDVLPGKQVDEDTLLLKSTSLYGGAAGIALFYLRLYVATGDEEWLKKARAGAAYVMKNYKGKEDFTTEQPYLQGAYIGYLNGPAGGGYLASELYRITGDEEYKTFAVRVTDDCILSANEENGRLFWYGDYGIIGEGGLILYLVDSYERYGDERYIQAAAKAAAYILDKKEPAPDGGYRWYVMPTETFPTIGKPGGYFPGFEYGAAGCGYILAEVYKHVAGNREVKAPLPLSEYIEAAQGAAEYIMNIADYSEDGEAALVRYNDTYLTDIYYLGVCQGPVGTSRLFYSLYEITGEERYKDFVVKLTNGLLATGAPAKHSEGYWRTNCYCCGAAGMLEHFLNVHKLTGDDRYLSAAYDAAETIIGESTYRNKLRNWYTAWNRHEPETSDPYIGLYHGSAGCASSLIAFARYISGGDYLPPYLEDPYKDLYRK